MCTDDANTDTNDNDVNDDDDARRTKFMFIKNISLSGQMHVVLAPQNHGFCFLPSCKRSYHGHKYKYGFHFFTHLPLENSGSAISSPTNNMIALEAESQFCLEPTSRVFIKQRFLLYHSLTSWSSKVQNNVLLKYFSYDMNATFRFY